MNEESLTQEASKKPQSVVHGGRNLAILGLISVTLAIVASGVSLFIYSATGDIYLDRSRPGFISKDEKKDEEKDKSEQAFTFSPDGSVNAKSLEEYLENFDKEAKKITNEDKAFSEDALSDETLNITYEEDGSL